MKKKNNKDYHRQSHSKLSSVINFITILITPLLLITTFMSIFITYQSDIGQWILKISLYGSIFYDFIIIIKHLQASQYNKIRTLYYDLFFHHLINDACIIITKSYSCLFLISKMPNYVYRIAIILDHYVSKKSSISGLSDIFLNFSRPILKSVNLQLFRATTEILILPYLLGITVLSLCFEKLIAFLVDFFFFILLAYRADPFHRTIFQSFNNMFEKEAYSRTENLKNLLYSNSYICEKIEFVGKLIYPIPFMY